MAAWMHAVSAMLPPVERQNVTLIDCAMPATVKGEIVKVLANMIFTKHREVVHGVC
jgi:hypothetical protein